MQDTLLYRKSGYIFQWACHMAAIFCPPDIFLVGHIILHDRPFENSYLSCISTSFENLQQETKDLYVPNWIMTYNQSVYCSWKFAAC